MENNRVIIKNSDENSEDSISVISDITDIATGLDPSEIEITAVFENKLQKMSVDELKDKCKENFIIGLSKLKKSELIQLLMNLFVNIWRLLKNEKLQDLRDIYKTNKMKVKYSNGTSKKHIINNIMNYNSKCETLMLIQSINYNNFQKDNIPSDTSLCDVVNLPRLKQEDDCPQSAAKAELREIQRLHAEAQLKETLKLGAPKKEKHTLNEAAEIKKKQQRIQEETAAAAAAEAELKEKQQRIQEETDTAAALAAEAELKKRKSKIPKNVKINVWNTHIDPNIQRHKCLCCKKSIISITEFHVGHVISENAGGTLEINNLRPICASCNYSMGTANMIDYIVKYGYYLS